MDPELTVGGRRLRSPVRETNYGRLFDVRVEPQPGKHGEEL